MIFSSILLRLIKRAQNLTTKNPLLDWDRRIILKFSFLMSESGIYRSVYDDLRITGLLTVRYETGLNRYLHNLRAMDLSEKMLAFRH